MNTPISTFYDYFPGSALTPGIPPILGAGKLIEFEDYIGADGKKNSGRLSPGG